MSAASRREQQLAAGGVYHPRQRVDVNINGTWRPGQIQNVANFTVRNSITRGETNKPPNQVFAIGGDPNSTGANTHYMPGSQILFQGPHRWIKLLGTLISKNYVVQINGRTETVPHTRLRPVAAMPRTMTDEEFYRRMQEMRRQANIAAGFDGNNTDDEEDDDEDEEEDENGEPRAARPRPAGAAFEVHNAFDEFKAKKFNTFMEIINKTTGTNTNFRKRRFIE
jgi:hypothetical protein